jgi:hypothetical protein
MSQHDYDIATADANTGTTFRAEVNAALQALASQNAGATAPTTTYAYMMWPDTTTGLLKIRNAANSAWITIGTLASANLGLWVPSFASAAEVLAGTEAAKAIAPDQLRASGIYKDVNRMLNVGLAATVSAKALTVALKGEDGNDPSASNPVTIAFRDETLTTGTPNVRTITGALSVVLASGGTLGFAAAEAGRLYVWALDNAGTVMLGLSRTADIFPESNLVADPVDIGSGSDLANTMYVTAHVHNLACRCLGYIEITTGATAGEWDNAPTKIQVMGPGIRRTGDIVQAPLPSQTGAYVTGTPIIPNDDTIPQITEGTEILTATLTPSSAVNWLHIRGKINMGAGAAVYSMCALFQDATADALAGSIGYIAGGGQINQVTIFHRMRAGTASATTIRLRYGTHSAGVTWELNGYGGRYFAGVMDTSLEVVEVFA